MRQLIFDGPAPHLGAVEFEVVQPEGFGSGKAVRTRRHTGQPFAQQLHHWLGPGRGVVATGTAGQPAGSLPLGTSPGVVCGERIKATGGQIELFRCLNGRQRALAEGIQYMANKGWRMAMGKLLMLFKDPQNRTCAWLRHQSFRRASLRSPSSKTGGAVI